MPDVQSFNIYYQISNKSQNLSKGLRTPKVNVVLFHSKNRAHHAFVCEFACSQGSFQHVANKVAIMDGQPQFKRAETALICYGIRS